MTSGSSNLSMLRETLTPAQAGGAGEDGDALANSAQKVDGFLDENFAGLAANVRPEDNPIKRLEGHQRMADVSF